MTTFNDADAVYARHPGLPRGHIETRVAVVILELEETTEHLFDACQQAHALLYHYDLKQHAGGVYWGDPEELRLKMIETLWKAMIELKPDLARAQGQ